MAIETTGDSSATDGKGEFVIKSRPADSEVPLLFNFPEFPNRFLLRDVTEKIPANLAMAAMHGQPDKL